MPVTRMSYSSTALTFVFSLLFVIIIIHIHVPRGTLHLCLKRLTLSPPGGWPYQEIVAR